MAATASTYTTRSGSVYAVAHDDADHLKVRKTNGDGRGPIDVWTDAQAVTVIPAAIRWPGTQGHILEIRLDQDQIVYTSPLDN